MVYRASVSTGRALYEDSSTYYAIKNLSRKVSMLWAGEYNSMVQLLMTVHLCIPAQDPSFIYCYFNFSPNESSMCYI